MKRYAKIQTFGYDFRNGGLLLDQTVTNNAGCAKDFSFSETFDRHVFSRKTLRGKKLYTNRYRHIKTTKNIQ